MHYDVVNKQTNTKVARILKMFTDYVIDVSTIDTFNAEAIMLCVENNVSARMLVVRPKSRLHCYELMDDVMEAEINAFFT
jgi:hypothetical protein